MMTALLFIGAILILGPFIVWVWDRTDHLLPPEARK